MKIKTKLKFIIYHTDENSKKPINTLAVTENQALQFCCGMQSNSTEDPNPLTEVYTLIPWTQQSHYEFPLNTHLQFENR